METLLNVSYIAAVILMTWTVLSFIVKESTVIQRKATTAICGIILAVVYMVWIEGSNLGILIIDYFACIQFYDIIKEYIIKGISKFYNSGKGVL
jgi:hypothetical protein